MVPVAIATAATGVLSAALAPQGVPVYRNRARAINRDDQSAILVSVAASRAERYGIDGSADWRVSLRLVAFGRSLEYDDGISAEQRAAQALSLAHEALRANPTLGIPGLDWDNAFTMAEDHEDFDEELSALVAIYEYQICTQGTAATV